MKKTSTVLCLTFLLMLLPHIFYGEKKTPDPVQSWNGTYFQDQGDDGLSVLITISQCNPESCIIEDIAQTNYVFGGDRMGSCGFNSKNINIISAEQATAHWSLDGIYNSYLKDRPSQEKHETIVCTAKFVKSSDGKLTVTTNGKCEEGFGCINMASTKILDGEFHKIYKSSFSCDSMESLPRRVILSKTENAICQNEELASLDLELSQLFKKKQESGISKKKSFILSQKKWIQERNACANRSEFLDCLKKSYQSRINELK